MLRTPRVLRNTFRRRRIAVFAVLCLLAGLATADRVAARIAAGRLADRLRCAAKLAERPRVSLGGLRPFAYQAMIGQLSTVRVELSEVHRGPLTASSVKVVANDVTRNAGGLSVGSLTAEVAVSYETLTSVITSARTAKPGTSKQAATIRQIRGESGMVAVELTVARLAREIPLTVYAAPAIDGRTLSLRPVEVEALGMRMDVADLPPGLLSAIGGSGNAGTDRSDTNATGTEGSGAGRAVFSRDLPELPHGLGYRSVAAGQDALKVTVTGTAVTTPLAATNGHGSSNDTCRGSTS